MTFSGDLAGISLADVFQNIGGNRSTGWLTVEWRQRTCHVRFVEGGVTGFSLGENELLMTADFLTQRGLVADDAMDRLRAKLRRSRKSPLHLAIQAKLLDSEAAADAVYSRISEQIYDLMLLKEATFSFFEGQPPVDMFDADQDASPVRIEIGPLLMEGARRRDEWQQIRRVLGSDRDLVVLLEGWEEFELAPLPAQVAAYLDGRTDVRAIMQNVTASRFDIMKAIAELVHEGVARLATAEELAGFAADARVAEDFEAAVRLLQQALTLERSNRDLRVKLVDLLVDLDRCKDAAAELAKLAHVSAADGDVGDALEFYARAFELDPEDVPLLEQRVALLQKEGDDAGYVEGVRELVRGYLRIGAADRARSALRTALSKRSLRANELLLELLAGVESSLGHWDESARVYRSLGEQVLGADEVRGLAFLRSALEQTPDDDPLCARIRDVESGRARRRNAGRRRLVVAAAIGAASIGLGVAGIAEFRATRAVLEAFDGTLVMLRGDGDAVQSLANLEAVRQHVIWSPTRSRATALFDRLVDVQLALVEDHIRGGDYSRARGILQAMIDGVDRADLHRTCRAMLDRVDTEARAREILIRADREGEPNPADLQQLAALTDGRYLDFHLAHIATVQNPRAREAMLLALIELGSPRAVPTVARLLLSDHDSGVISVIKTMLEKAHGIAPAERSAEWATLRAEMHEAVLVDEFRDPARFVLDTLFR